MNGKAGLLKGRILFAAVFLLMQAMVFLVPYRAQASWNEFSSSIRNSFSGSQGLSLENLLGFAATIVLFTLVFLVFRHAPQGREKASYQKFRSPNSLKPPVQQKRYWFRMPASLEFEWVLAGAALRAGKNKYYKDRLVNISGGGLCFKTAVKLKQGDDIKLILDFGEGKTLPLGGKVVRSEGNGDSGIYRVAVQFENIKSGERDRVISLIMKYQREFIQKGKKTVLPLGQTPAIIAPEWQKGNKH